MTKREVARTVDALAAHRLVSARAVDPVEITDENADACIGEVEQHRISGVAVLALAEGSAVGSDEVGERFIALHDRVMAQTMRVEIMAIRVSSLFGKAGIRHRLLKGAALAHTIYLDPAERSFRDVDVLVPASQIDDAVSLLASEGATRSQPELRAGYDRRFSKSVTMKLDGIEVDLHRLLCPGAFGVWMKPNDLFVLSDSISLAGVDIPILDPTNNLVHACYHAALGQVEPALSNVRDIAVMALADGDRRFDRERFDQTVDRWRGRVVIARAVRLVQQRLGNVLPDELAKYAQIPVEEVEEEALGPYLTKGSSGRFGALAPGTLKALAMSDRPGYALAVGLPDGAEPVDRIKSLISRRRGRG